MLDRSPTKQWLVDSRGDMKVGEVVRLLDEAGYRTRDREPVKELTFRGWEAPSGGEVPRKVIPYLERIFKSKAPGWNAGPADQTAVVAAIDRQTVAINRQADALIQLVKRLDALAVGQKVLAEEVASIVDPELARRRIAAARSETPPERRRRGSSDRAQPTGSK